MDGLLRLLRGGVVKDGEPAPLVVLADTLLTQGGPALFRKILQEFQSASLQQRSQADVLHVAAVDGSPASYESLLSAMAPRCRVVDAYSDPFCWQGVQGGSIQQAGPPATASTGSLSLPMLQRQLLGLSPQNQAADDAPPGTAIKPHVCVVVDSISTLFLRYSYLQVLLMLDNLRDHPSVSCVLTCLHEDLHEPHIVEAVEAAAVCIARLQPVSELQRTLTTRQLGRTPHGQVHVRSKRRLGRVKVDNEFYTLQSPAVVELYPPPKELLVDAHALVASQLKASKKQEDAAAAVAGPQPATQPSAGAATATAPTAAVAAEKPGDALAAAVGSSMRLTLNEREKAAKERVVLPFQHQGQSSRYDTSDYRNYLPAAAGGRGDADAQINKLGHIMYVRDSEEEHDSDEDPDDDLDI